MESFNTVGRYNKLVWQGWTYKAELVAYLREIYMRECDQVSFDHVIPIRNESEPKMSVFAFTTFLNSWNIKTYWFDVTCKFKRLG